jgi:hypothetical protein
VLELINKGELFFPTDQAIPAQAFASLVDSGIERLDEVSGTFIRERFTSERDTAKTLDQLGTQLGLNRESVPQLESESITNLTRIHGAKIFQIGKLLGTVSKLRPIEFTDISNPLTPLKFSAEFYLSILQKMFPGLKIGSPAPQAPTLTEASPDDLRNRIFGA